MSNSFIEEMLGKMTLHEKAGQMTQLTLGALLKGDSIEADKPYTFDPELLNEAFNKYPVGSFLNTPGEALTLEEWHGFISELQKKATSTRLGIPVIYGIDSTHGAGYVNGATLFPHQISMAASWNLDMAQEAAHITALESRAAGLTWNFSPVQDICTKPSWPRLYEGFGESPYLASRMGEALVKGYQGDDLKNATRVAACLKHYIGYGAPNTGKDRTPAYIPERILRQDHLPPFEAGIEAGAATIMINSGDVNGVPVHASRWLLTDILRDELGFEGLVVTDWEDIQYLHTRHRVADSHREAVRMAIEAGIDMSMVPDDLSFPGYIVDLVEKGELSEERIDDSVRRILSLKHALGLFENPMGGEKEAFTDFGFEKHNQLAYDLAVDSITLLKNDDKVLPLAADKKVLLTGPTADSRSSIVGGWSYNWQGDAADEAYPEQVPTIKEVMQEALGNHCSYIKGADFDKEIDVQKAVDAAQDVDVIVCCLGEKSYTEFFGNVHDAHLPQAQKNLVGALLDTGKPVVLLLLEGRPRIITEIAQRSSAILMGYLPGQAGAQALVDIVLGKAAPAGRLPFTYPIGPNAPEGLHAPHNEYTMPQGASVAYAPLFPFGHGLSYTNFTYNLMAISDTTITGDQDFTVTIRVKNTGESRGSEVVQLYLHDHFASVIVPRKRLVRFEKISLKPGEHRDVVFTLNKHDLALVNAQNAWITEPGVFSLMSGGLEVEFEWRG